MQLQNYVFFLEVQPSLPSSVPVMHSAYTYPSVPIQEQCHGAGLAYTAHVQAMGCPPATTSTMSYTQPIDFHQNVQMMNTSGQPTGSYYTYDGRRIPSPDNAHAKACSFSEQYLTANSPFHMAPARPLSGSFSVPNVPPLSLQAAHIQAALLAQHDLEQQYSASYSAAAMDTEMQLQGMTPMDYTTTGQDRCMNMTSRPTSSNFTMYGGGSGSAPSLLDSYEEAGTTTTCSTRTCSPYPGLYARSYSGSNLSMGTGPYCGGQNMSVHNGNMISTPSMYPCNAGNTGMYHPQQQQMGWASAEAAHRHRSGSLSIYTDPCALDMETSYPLQRSDSGSCSMYNPSLQLQVPLHRQVSFPRTSTGAGVPPVGVYSTNDASAEYTSPLYPRSGMTNTGYRCSPPHSAPAAVYAPQHMQPPQCGRAGGDYMRGDYWPQGGRSAGKVVTPPPSYYHQHLQPLYASGVGVNTAGAVPSHGLLRQMSEEECVTYPSQGYSRPTPPNGVMLRAGVM